MCFAILTDTRWDASFLQPKCYWKEGGINCYLADNKKSWWCISYQSMATEYCSYQTFLQASGRMPCAFWGFFISHSIFFKIISFIKGITTKSLKSGINTISHWLFLVNIKYIYLLYFSIILAQHNKTADTLLMGSSVRSPDAERPASPKYSDRLSPAVNLYLSEASRQEIRVPVLFELHSTSC